MRNWFDRLQPREKLMVLGTGVFVVIALVVAFGIRPLYVNSSKAAERLADRETRLARFEQAAARIGPVRPGGGGGIEGREQSMVVVVDRSTRNRGLGQYLKRNQPDGNTGIRLRFEGAPFDDLIAWITEAQTRYGMKTMSANFDQADAPGRVNCSLVLDRPGA